MPLEETALTKKQVTNLKHWFDTKINNTTCESCGEDEWDIMDHLLSGVPYKNGLDLTATFPQAVIVCLNCAQVRTFMAAVIPGVLDREDPEETALPEEVVHG